MLSRMIQAGFSFEIVGDKLRVIPGDKLTDEQADFIRNHKSELMAEVQEFALINRWLDAVGETDAVLRAQLIERCKQSPKAKALFLSFASELDLPDDDSVVSITRGMPLADCSTCRHQIRSNVNPEGGLSHCAIRWVGMKLPHYKRECDKHEPL